MKLFAIVFAAVLLAGGIIYGIHSWRVEKQKAEIADAMVNAQIKGQIVKIETALAEWKDYPLALRNETRGDIRTLSGIIKQSLSDPRLSKTLRNRVEKLVKEIEEETR